MYSSSSASSDQVSGRVDESLSYSFLVITTAEEPITLRAHGAAHLEALQG